jgi:hypothetical protein
MSRILETRGAATSGSALPFEFVNIPILCGIIAFSLGVFLDTSAVRAQILRVAAYNVDADTPPSGGCSSPQASGCPDAGPGLTTVLQAIGNEQLAGHSQPIDVLALEELAFPVAGMPSETMQFVVDQLNAIYPTANYAYDATNDPTTGGTGGGPSGLVYNKNTVKLLSASAVGSVSGSMAARAPMRYKLAPAGYSDDSADFWMYVSHMKSGSAGTGSGSNGDRRNKEAQEIRADAATAIVGPNAHIIYTGDYNMDGSSEPGYQTMVAAGTGQAIDTLTRSFNSTSTWDTTSTYKSLLTETATFDQFRDDLQLVTNPMLTQPGMQLVTSSLTAFGNGGNIYHTSVTSASNSAALADLGMPPYTPAYRTSVLSALTTATDHLPIVADYSFASAVGIPGDYDHSGVVDAADYNLWQSSFGSTTSLAADGNGDGEVDAADYDVWRSHFAGPGAGAAGSAAVPEPNSALLLLVGGCLAGLVAGKLRR